MPKYMASYILGIPLYSYNSPFSHQSRLPTCLGNSQRSNITPSFYYLRSEMYFVTATGGWIQRIQILQSSVSSPSFTSVLKPGPRCADDQMDLWCNLRKPLAPCELENQRQDFRMALEQRLSSLCYLIANFHRLFSLTCSTFSATFSAGTLWQNALVVLCWSFVRRNSQHTMTAWHNIFFDCCTFIVAKMFTHNKNYVSLTVATMGCCKHPHAKLLTVCSPIFPSGLWIEPTSGKTTQSCSSIMSKLSIFEFSVEETKRPKWLFDIESHNFWSSWSFCS